MSLSDAELLALHAELVATPSVSGAEGPIADRMAGFLAAHGAAVERLGDTLLAFTGPPSGGAPLVVFDSHLDTVPAAPGWSRDPTRATREADRIYGLGANDAKASAAAMTAAFLAAAGGELPFTLALALVEGEETTSAGTARVVAALAERGLAPWAAVVGEPTSLDVAVAQKGLLVLELVARGEAAHAAHARALGARNAALALARDLVALAALPPGPEDPWLGRATVEPTVLSAGSARNVVPAEARAVLDCRTVPAEPPEDLVARLAAAVEGELAVLSDRLRPVATAIDSPLVAAARRARPSASLYGSATLSDLVFFRDCPAIKVGPGESARSHRADEYVRADELIAGAAFYRRLLDELAAELAAPGRGWNFEALG